jgi:hypothetical protein
LSKVVSNAGLCDWIDGITKRKQLGQTLARLPPAAQSGATVGQPRSFDIATASQVVIDQVTQDMQRSFVAYCQVFNRHKSHIGHALVPDAGGTRGVVRIAGANGNVSALPA